MNDDGTVEWGDAERSAGWLDRILGSADETGRRRLSGPALSCAVLAAAFLAAAELLPWMSVKMVGNVATESSRFPANGEFTVEQIGSVQLIGYYLGWLVLASLTGIALVLAADRRRLAVAGGAGVAVFVLVLLASLTRRVVSGADQFGNADIPTSAGPGLFFAFGAVVLATAALLVAGWQPGRQRRPRHPDLDPEVDLGPADLTVTSFQQSP